MLEGTVIGADACPNGWVATVIDADTVGTEIYEDFETLRKTYAESDRILVDIPIGLPQDERRRCDEDARDLLGSRGISVFYPPCRNAAKLTDYQEANDKHRDQIGHGLSQQAYNISEKILKVAAVVGEQYNGIVRESHPELCFAALNDQPIAYSKTSDQGRQLRMKLLSEALDDAKASYRNTRNEYPLKDVGRDDILDSMVLAVAAREENLTTVPTNPSSDEPRIYHPDFAIPASEW